MAEAQLDASVNGNHVGQPIDLNAVADNLQEEATSGYRPQIPLEGLWVGDKDSPNITLRRDIEFMLMHPVVSIALEYYKSGISGAEFWGGPDHNNPENDKGKPISKDPRVSEFVLVHCERFWQRGVSLLQEGGYAHGWGPGEHIYKEVNGYFVWSHLKDFHPNDAHILTTEKFDPIGIRVKNVRGKQPINLHFASENIPAKGCWYIHRPRFNRFYGRSQLIGAWRPWRRLGWRDAVEQVIDAAIYRAGYRGPIVRHPQEEMQTAKQGVPATVMDGGGHPRRSARDVARQMVEWAKAGAGFTLSSAQYPDGGNKWDVEWPDHVMDVRPLIDAARYLEDQIMLGIGVPPELVKASESGSGYSGRSVPREAFLDGQQKVADALLQMFVEQVLRPLVLWNFGDIPFEVTCKSLLKSQSDEKQGSDQQQGGQQKPQPGKDSAGNEPPTPPKPPMGQEPQQPQPVLSINSRVNDIIGRVLRRAA